MRILTRKREYCDTKMALLIKLWKTLPPATGLRRIMIGRERWHELCEQAVVEEDPKKLFELVQEINQLLEERREQLKRLRTSRPAGAVE